MNANFCNIMSHKSHWNILLWAHSMWYRMSLSYQTFSASWTRRGVGGCPLNLLHGPHAVVAPASTIIVSSALSSKFEWLCSFSWHQNVTVGLKSEWVSWYPVGTTSSLPRGPWNDVGASGLAGLVLYVFPLFVDDLVVVDSSVVLSSLFTSEGVELGSWLIHDSNFKGLGIKWEFLKFNNYFIFNEKFLKIIKYVFIHKATSNLNFYFFPLPFLCISNHVSFEC